MSADVCMSIGEVVLYLSESVSLHLFFLTDSYSDNLIKPTTKLPGGFIFDAKHGLVITNKNLHERLINYSFAQPNEV